MHGFLHVVHVLTDKPTVRGEEKEAAEDRELNATHT